MGFTVAVIGMGLMGASLAGALKGFKDAEIVGMDISGDVCTAAEQKGIVSRCTTDINSAVKDADLVIFCVYPHHIPKLIEQCRDTLKAGAVITDICGVKKPLYDSIFPLLPNNTEYIGVHPMAGRERDGIENSDSTLYRNSGFLICTSDTHSPQSLELVQDMAKHIGCARIETVDYIKHDEIIAYTSDLMHIASAGLCLSYHSDLTLTFTAGAFRDCTRIADINADAWTELLLANKDCVVDCLDKYIDDLKNMRESIAQNDNTKLHELLTRAGDNKREMLTK